MSDPLAALAAGVGVSAVCDALGRRRAHRAHIQGLVSPAPGRRLAGPCATIAFLPLRRDLFDPERHEFGALVREAVAGAPDARVLVAAAPGHPDWPVAGGKKLARLANLGLAGILTDARLRDFGEVVSLGLAAWCRGEAVRNANDVLMPWAANVPVAVDGVTVVPGDYVVADAAGAVVIPAADAEAVLREAAEIEAADAGAVARARESDRAWLAERRGGVRAAS